MERLFFSLFIPMKWIHTCKGLQGLWEFIIPGGPVLKKRVIHGEGARDTKIRHIHEPVWCQNTSVPRTGRAQKCHLSCCYVQQAQFLWASVLKDSNKECEWGVTENAFRLKMIWLLWWQSLTEGIELAGENVGRCRERTGVQRKETERSCLACQAWACWAAGRPL